MKEFYGDIKEDISPNLPEAIGIPAQNNVFVDEEQAGNRMERMWHTGIILLLNKYIAVC